ncbi:uncharacterized protein [Littorina saxatilis]|uniref:Flap endonuclease GEN homolog 1 n=1 Tax=Littorina saxatilis TaxID=31220 RepID=A0AAN9B8N2_9CAEN
MGVTGLWPILAPVKKRRSLHSLCGQTLAVDLSIWVCENQGVRQMQGKVQKPHLRNLFFRVSSLIQHGVKLIFVVEGEAPALKHQAMATRLHARNKGAGAPTSKKKFGRGTFKTLLRECCELLDCLGVPYLQARGEAETLCAALNAAGVVDACVSDDGDCFLYDARVVYKNLTLDTKDPHVESYSISDITSELGLTRERLVALALLLGCDYYPAGVPGVGEAWAVKLMASLATVDVLKRFREWRHMAASDCIDSTEVLVWRKASSLPDFPPQKVIDEFLVPKEKVPRAPPVWQRPQILKMLALGTRYLDWVEQYSLEKILPLTTLWDQLSIMEGSFYHSSGSLIPGRIVKRRVRQGVPCFEVEWTNTIKGLTDEDGRLRQLITLEQEDRFQVCFPALVESFLQHTEDLKAAKSKRTRKTKPKKDTDAVAEDMEALVINSDSKDYQVTAVVTECFLQSFDDCKMDSQSTQPQSLAGARLKSEKLSSCHIVENQCSSLDSQDSVFETVGQTLLADELERKVQGNYSSTKNSSTRDRSVEYVPLGQRLEALTKGREADRECSGDMNRDNSYTYIPLSQRLKARLGSSNQQRSTSSSTSALSCERSLTKDEDSASQPNSVHSKKQLTKKKVQSSREEKDKVLCSQKSSKAAVLSNLLEDWSDSDEDETSEGENCDSLLDTEQKVVDYSTVRVTNTLENQVFSASSQQKEDIYISLSEEHTESVTPLLPYDTNVRGSERREELDLSQDAPSFISDGHFTLRHSFFTSMAESDVSKDSSALGDSDTFSQHCFTPESRGNHQTGATHHDSFTNASFNALSDSFADLVLDTHELPVSRANPLSNTQTTSKAVKSNKIALLMEADSSIASSPDAHVHESDLIDVEKNQLQSVSVGPGHDSVNHQVLGQYSTSTTASVLLHTAPSKTVVNGDSVSVSLSTPPNTVTSGDSVSILLSTVPSKAVASSCDSAFVCSNDVMVCTKLSVRQGGSTAGGESSPPTSSSSSLEKEAPVVEAHESESSLDVSFLPLSQRLRLKKPNAKLLKSLNNL